MTNDAPPPAIAHFTLDNHRYRFWHLFPWGDMVETSFAMTGRLSPEDADRLACLYWAHGLERAVADGQRLPDSMQAGTFVVRRMSDDLARHIIQNSNYEVLRPGEVE